MLKRRPTHRTIYITALLGLIMGAMLWGCAETGPTTGKGLASPEAAAGAAPPLPAAGPPDGPIPDEESLQNTDCEKCHIPQPLEIMTAGGKHGTSVTCQDCHQEHPPLGTQTIPECVMCHEGERHFQLDNCLACHENPHTPLKLNVADTPEVSKGCQSCHADKGNEFKQFPSRHAEQNCTLCHPGQHKVIEKCATCHKPHNDTMQYQDCLACHQPHSPLAINPGPETASGLCGSCHADELAMLAGNTTNHAKLTCAFCHQGKHPAVPACADCHAAPHSAGMLKNFPDCLQCHHDPHDLKI